MRIGAVVPCYKMTHFLKDCLRCLKDLDEVLVLNSNIGWDGIGEDDTPQKIMELGQNNVKLVKGTWKNQTKQRNFGIGLSSCDFVILLDSDEILLDVDTVVEYVKEKNPQAICCKIHQYVKDFEHLSDYDHGHRPVIGVSKDIKITDVRCVPCNPEYVPVVLHHMKFLQPKEDLLWRKLAKEQKRPFSCVQKFINIDMRRLNDTIKSERYKNDIEGMY